MSGREAAGRLAASLRAREPLDPPDLRPAVAADLAACARVWQAGISDYQARLNQPTFQSDLEPIRRLFAHLLETDPDRFWVATRPAPDGRPAPGDTGAGGQRIVGFGSANARGRVWFLAMLFVDPAEQARGLGRALLDRLLADSAGLVLGTATDSAQPISNALYARLGIVPRVPVLNLVGRAERFGILPPLPGGVSATPFDAVGADELAATLGSIDDELLGYRRSADHAWLRDDGRIGCVYRDGNGAAIGYGYTSRVGRVGPVAALAQEDLAAFVGHLLGVVIPAGAQSLWVPGSAGAVVSGLLRAGFRLEPFPALLCWTEPLADLGRYLPISLALL